MSRLRRWGWAAFVVGLIGGTFDNRTTLDTAPPMVGDEYVLEADFHVHSFPGDGLLSPLGVVLHARRRGLDVIAITNHNQILAAKMTRAVSRLVGGPLVLVGQEITSPTWHLIGVGLERKVAWQAPLPDVIEGIHAQGGLAIAAHPTARFHAAFGDVSRLGLDGCEVVHGMAVYDDEEQPVQELRDFYATARRYGIAAIGSTDHHFFDLLGSVRTYVFAKTATREGILAAIREGHTVVIEPGGRAFGDAVRAEALIPLLRKEPPRRSVGRVAFSLLGLVGVSLAFFTRSCR